MSMVENIHREEQMSMVENIHREEKFTPSDPVLELTIVFWDRRE